MPPITAAVAPPSGPAHGPAPRPAPSSDSGSARLLAVARHGAAATAADRSGLAVSAFFYVMVTSVLATLWATAARNRDGSVAGYGTAALIWYVFCSEAAVTALPQRLIETLGDDIGSARIEADLLRPASVLRVRLASTFGAALPRLALCTALGLGLAVLAGGPPPNAAALVLAAPALVLAAAVNLTAQCCFGAAAFWLREAKSTWFLYQKLVFMLGGMLLPLEVLPGPMETAAKWSPFAAMSYVPARLASGHLEPGWLAVQLAWLAVLAGLATLVFAAGERRLVGGLQ